jgi:hypothetical protein
MAKALALGVVLALLAAGCGGSAAGGTTGPGTGCTPRGAVLRGDVDGDQTADAVRLYACPGGYSVSLDGSSGSSTEYFTARRPVLAGLAQIDTQPGLEVVVESGNAPRSGIVLVFSKRSAGLLSTSIQPDAIPGFAFGRNGDIRHAVDCTGGPGSNRVVYTEAIRNGSVDVVTRYYYDITGLQFSADLNSQGLHAHDHVPAARLVQRYPEFGTMPFGSCMAVRAGA